MAYSSKQEKKPRRRKLGHPSLLEDIDYNFVTRLAMLGLKEKQIAGVLGISEETFYQWKKRDKEFRQALELGEIGADTKVVQALYEKAIGYEYEETQVVTVKGKPQVVRYKKKLPPETYAINIWLRNRHPELWCTAQRMELTGKSGQPITTANFNVNIDLSKYTDEELVMFERIGFKMIGKEEEIVESG